MRSLPILGLIILTLSACTSERIYLHSTTNEIVGEIKILNATEALVLDTYGQGKGKVINANIQSSSGEVLGSITTEDGNASILNASGMQIGKLSDGRNCYGKDDNLRGTVSAITNVNAAAGACFLLLLQK